MKDDGLMIAHITGILKGNRRTIAGILGECAASAAFLYGAAIGFLTAGLFVIAERRVVEQTI